MTNGLHAQKALAYDVAIGRCSIKKEDMDALRTIADWRFLKGLDDENAHKKFFEYFKYGKYDTVSVFEWASKKEGEGSMPAKIIDKREMFAGRSEPR